MIAAAWRLETYDSLPSTADLCRQRAEAGAAEGLAILARRQTAGRGRRGRRWEDGEGNLFLSALLRPGGAMAAIGAWSLLAAVALAEAVAGLLPAGVPLKLKWPNDLLLDGGKLAGILVEGGAAGDQLAWLGIGFGVNLRLAPEVAGRRTAALAAYGPPLAPEAFAPILLASLDRWREAWAREGFGVVRAAFLARGPMLGTLLRLRCGSEEVAGRFAGLGEDGALLLSLGERVQSFCVGELAFGEAEEGRASCCW